MSINSPRRPLARSRNGWIFGVCRGLADYAEISVVWVRLLAFVGFFLTSGWPLVLIYIVAAIFMRPRADVEAPRNAEEWDLHCAYTTDRSMAVQRLKRKFDQLDRRTRRMEGIVTDREFDWERRFNSGV